jgi:hypothetical protein
LVLAAVVAITAAVFQFGGFNFESDSFESEASAKRALAGRWVGNFQHTAVLHFYANGTFEQWAFNRDGTRLDWPGGTWTVQKEHFADSGHTYWRVTKSDRRYQPLALRKDGLMQWGDASSPFYKQ